MVRPAEDQRRRRRRRGLLALGGLGAFLFAFTGYLDRSGSGDVTVGAVDRLVIINTAGPVTVRSGAETVLSHEDSWLLSRPRVETASADGETVIRVACEGLGPCRSSVSLEIAGDPDLVILSAGSIEVDRFDGQMTAVSSAGDVVLGPVQGSARLLADGRIDGFALQVDQLDAASVTGEVMLDFASAPRSVMVDGPGDVALSLPDDGYAVETELAGELSVDVDQPEGAGRRIEVRADGDVAILVRP